MEPKSVLDCVHIFFVCPIGRRFVRRFLRIKNCQDPLIFAFFLVEPLVSASAGATPPLYGIVRGLLVWNFTVCGGYEVDIYICFALLTHVVLLLCFCYSLVQFDLLGGCRTQWGPLNVLNPSPSAISIFSRPRSVSRSFVLFLVTKFLFLELGPTGSVSRSGRVRNHPIAVVVALVRSVSLQGPSVWRSQLFACAVLVTNVTIFSRNLFSHISAFSAPWDYPTGSTTIFSRAGCDGDVRSSSSCTWCPMTPKIGEINSENVFSEKKIFSTLFVSTLVMMHDDPPPPPKRQCLSEVVHYSHVSWWECGSCEGFMLCMSSFIYLFVVFLCRPVDDVAFVYL